MTYSHIIDSRFHGGGYSTEESKAIFSDLARLKRWLQVEGTLAEAQAELDIIPVEAAEEINKYLDIETFDLDMLRTDIERTGHSLVPLLRQLQNKCTAPHGQYVHYGATTQDIQDTGQMLAIQQILAVIDRDMSLISDQLQTLANTHRHTLQTGRTHAQPALPITFGLKVASWYDELRRCQERMLEGRNRVVVGQLFGACGTLSVFDEAGLSLVKRFCQKLNLNEPPMAWHVARDRLGEYVVNLAILTASLARMADEIRTLSRHEFRELTLTWQQGTLGSSTMPHKRNPEECEQVVVLARLVKAQATAMLEAQIVDHERDYRGTRIEWVAVTDASHYTLKAMDLTKKILSLLEVNESVMKENVMRYREEVCSEAIMFALARHLGKQDAYQVMYELSQASLSNKISLADLLKRDARINSHLSDTDIDELLDPASQTGIIDSLID
ncbi:MAG: adenylosuccinate lyase family protein, partial [Saprospiraceae bacterium]|nr:adenylosuccinate lyase family protein [Saprospiraceae bacterium]